MICEAQPASQDTVLQCTVLVSFAGNYLNSHVSPSGTVHMYVSPGYDLDGGQGRTVQQD